jgi:hypothetical protein
MRSTISRSPSARKRRPLQRVLGQRPRRRRMRASDTIHPMGRWWTDIVDIVALVPRSMRTGGRFGRLFRLRDRGLLDEALQEALRLTHDLLADMRLMDESHVILPVVISTVQRSAVDRPSSAACICRTFLSSSSINAGSSLSAQRRGVNPRAGGPSGSTASWAAPCPGIIDPLGDPVAACGGGEWRFA